MSKFATIAAGILIATSASALAHGPSVDQRQDRQARAIEHGRQAGSITWLEGLKLRAEQRRIARVEAQYKADGRLDRNERKTLDRLLDDAARNIADERRDARRRPDWLPRVGR